MKKRIVHSLNWFMRRIGKTIHRKPIKYKGKVCCKDCQKTEVRIWGKNTAQHLFVCQNEMDINYFDKK